MATWEVGQTLANGATVSSVTTETSTTGTVTTTMEAEYPNGSYERTVRVASSATSPPGRQAAVVAKLLAAITANKTFATEAASWTFPLSTAEQKKLLRQVEKLGRDVNRLVRLVQNLTTEATTPTPTTTGG